MGKGKGKKSGNKSQKKLSDLKNDIQKRNPRKVRKLKNQQRKKKEKVQKNVLKNFRFSQLTASQSKAPSKEKEKSKEENFTDNVVHLKNEQLVGAKEIGSGNQIHDNVVFISDSQDSNDDFTILDQSFFEKSTDGDEITEDVKHNDSILDESDVSSTDKAKHYIANENYEGIHSLLLLNDSVKVIGKFQLQVLKGSINILGYEVSSGSPQLSVYSSSAMAVFCLHGSNKAMSGQFDENAMDRLRDYFPDWEGIKEETSSHTTAVLIKELRSKELEFICKHKPEERIFLKSLKFGLSRSELSHTVNLDPWTPVVNKIVSMSHNNQDFPIRILLCGNKNTGKSMFSRFLANSIINSSGPVFYLDCDVGQTEFTPPGLISLTKIDMPLTGPPFTHQRKPIASLFFGNTSPRDEPSLYVQCIQEAFQFYMDRHQSDGPLIVNTQGWIKGMGLPLLVDVIRIVKPSLVLQFRHPSEDERSFVPITAELAQSQPGWAVEAGTFSSDGEIQSPCKSSTIYQIIERPRVVRSDKLKLKAVDYRKLSLLSYFAPMLHRCKQSELGTSSRDYVIERPFLSLAPRIVYWKDVAVHVMHSKVSPRLILASLNFSLVSLAYVHPAMMVELSNDTSPDGPKFLRQSPVASHIGYGFIRNIDIGMKAFFILTPVPLDDLKEVNALLKGNIGMPPELFEQGNISNSSYCLIEKQSVIRGTKARKPRYNLKRRRYCPPMTS